MTFGFKKIDPTKEIPSIDLLRGLASSMVCFFHLCVGNKLFLPEGNLMRKIGSYGWTGVEIFFVISGFVIPYSMYVKSYTSNSIGIFLKKRIIRIEPPYLISIVLVIVLNFVSTLSPYYRGSTFSIDWPNLMGHIAYLNVFTGDAWLNPVYWTLGVEFQYYLLISLSYGLIAGKTVLGRLLFFASFMGLTFCPWPENRFVFEFAGFFMSGILLFQWVCGIINKREFFILIGITAAVLWFRAWPLLMLLVLATLLAVVYINKVPKIFRNLGLISYSLYLIHVPIGGRIINLCDSLIQNVMIRQLVIVVAFFVCIGASILFYRYVERYFKRFSGSINYKSAQVAATSVVTNQ